MQQLLPEVVNIFERLKGKKVERISTEWQDFVQVVNKVDALAEEEKQKIITSVPDKLRELIKDAFSLKGNNDRVLTTYFGTISVGGDPKKCISILVATEIVDYSVLLIDDILDNQERRNGRVTLHLKSGIGTCLSVAMFLKSLSSQLILGAKNIEAEKKVRILKELERYHQGIYEGQLLDKYAEETSRWRPEGGWKFDLLSIS